MLYHCFATFKQSLLDFFKLLDSRLIGVDLTGILGTYGETYYNSPAVEAKKKQIFLHCNASNLVLKILQHDKIWSGTIPPVPNSGGTCSPPPSRDLRLLILMLLYDSINLIISGVHQ